MDRRLDEAARQARLERVLARLLGASARDSLKPVLKTAGLLTCRTGVMLDLLGNIELGGERRQRRRAQPAASAARSSTRGWEVLRAAREEDISWYLPTILCHRDFDVVLGTKHSKVERDGALEAATHLDEATLRSIEKCSQILRDITLLAPFHSVCHRDEDAILSIAADIHVLGQWVHTALAAFSDDRRVERRIWEREYATSPPPAQPLPQPTAPNPAPAKPRSRATPERTPTRPASKLSHLSLPSVPEEPATLTATAASPLTPRATPQPESPQRPRVIVRYGTAPSPPLRPHPRKIVQSLNSAFGRDLLAAVSYSRDDQLILHTKAPFTAQQLLSHDKIIRTTLDSLLYPTSRQKPAATFDTGQTWSKIVLHQVPLPVWTNKSAVDQQLDVLLSDFCASNGVNKSAVCRFRTLCSLDVQEKLFRASTERAPQLASILLCTTDHDAAERILRSGAIVQSGFCRTSTFRPRLRRDDTAAL